MSKISDRAHAAAARDEGILTLAGFMDPGLRVWIEERPSVREALARRP